MQLRNKILFNTGVNYARLIISTVTGIYSTRLILDALGSSDYGIFNIIAGTVSLLSFINATMTSASLRQITYSLGLGDIIDTQKIFASSRIIHICLGVVMFIFLEIVGVYLIKEQLKIANDKINTSIILLQFINISTVISIISVPYDSLIIAHENMLLNAKINIMESILKLLIAQYLYYTSYDKLLAYGFLLMLVSIVIRLLKSIYCSKNYLESKARIKQYDRKYVKEIFSFASWNLIGVIIYITRTQGIGVVLNLFYSTIINAAYGIASQINGQLSIFSSGATQAMQPQIIKSKAASENNKFINLSMSASKYSFFLFTLVAMSLSFMLKYILSIWLVEVPKLTETFAQLLIILTSLTQLSIGITISAHALGNIKRYQKYCAPIQILALPIGYITLQMGFPAYSIIIVFICIELIVLPISIWFFYKSTGCSIRTYLKTVIIPCVPSLLILTSIFSILTRILNKTIIEDFLLTSIFDLIYIGVFILFGTDKQEKLKIKEMILKFKSKRLSIVTN